MVNFRHSPRQVHVGICIWALDKTYVPGAVFRADFVEFLSQLSIYSAMQFRYVGLDTIGSKSAVVGVPDQ